MTNLVWTSNAIQNAVIKHKAAYAVLDDVLRDIADGKAIYRIGKGKKLTVLVKANSKKSAARQYYGELCRLLGQDSLCALSPSRLHEICKSMKNFKQPKGVNRVLRALYDYDQFGKGMVPKYIDHTLSWSSSSDGWSAWQYVHELDVHSCVYCNADTVFALQLTQGLKKSVKKRSALDHFYSHSEFPFVGITLSNLIPACTRCNSNVKGAKELEYGKYVYPYEDSFDEGARFAIAYAPGKALVNLEKDDVALTILPKCKSGVSAKALNSANFFCLKDIYNQLHREDALAILQRELLSSDSYIKFLKQKYPGIKDRLIDRVVNGMSLAPGDILKHNLTKMNIDLVSQLRG